MATLAGAQASVISGGTSSFGQFRLTTFVDSTPKASRTTAPSPIPRTASSGENAQPVSQHGENGSTLSSSRSLASFSNTLQSSPQTFAPTPPNIGATTTQSTAPASASHNGFGILDLGSHGSHGSHSSPQVREGKLGPHRDGRVRNPVPSKLKGRTDDKNGEFSVMHMDMSGSGGPNDIPRGEAAQRTSENTAQAARVAANNDSYKGVKRRRIEASINVQPTQDERLLQPPPSFSTSSQHTSSQHQQERLHRTRVLTSEETKYEQARLLTLLRSINPLTVVDHICKALAFFGGIPGAPPPENGGFPESADANGSGMLFVGWLSEIFPELERKAWRPEVLKSREVNRGPRPRGRPKGSKASKVRKDKGIKKGPKHPNKIDGQGVKAPAAPPSNPVSGTSAEVENVDDEWVDITEMDSLVEKDVSQGQGLLNPEGGRNGNLPKTRQQRSLTDQVSSANANMLDRRHDDEMDHQSFTNINQDFSPGMASSGKRRPGRPKGSRNRQRDLELEGSPRIVSISHANQHLPEASATPESQRRQAHPATSTPARQPPNASTQQSPQVSAKRRQGQVSKDTEPGLLQPGQIPGLTAEEQAVLEAFRTAQAVRTTNKPAAANDKAKRSRPKSGAHTADEASTTISSILPTGTTDIVPVASGKATMQGTPTSQPAYKDSGPILPPPKRQRKAKDPNATPAKKTTQNADASNSAPAPSAVLKSTTPSDSVVPAVVSNVRPPAQGLEAHYERFANLQHQGDQQQHQQSRHELNPATRSSPMQSASAYYQQPRHVSSPYDQQYTSHQTTNPYQPGLIPQSDSFRTNNQQHTNFPSQQQQASHQFSQFSNSSFIDVPALDSVTNGTANVGAYGQGISRSTNNANFSAGAQMGNDFESMSDINLGERLLRGIGRR
jgi:hypothetical protein